jgi:hypothetical protein
MNALPARKITRFVRQVAQIYSAPPGEFPELTYRRLQQEAQAMVRAGGMAALDGHVLAAALAPVALDLAAFDRHIAAARALSGNGRDAWVNEALFAVYFGQPARSARIVVEHLDEIRGDIEMCRLVHDLSLWCCLVDTAMMLADVLGRARKADGLPEFPCRDLSDRLADRGLGEFDLVERFSACARAGVESTGCPVRGYRVSGNRDDGFAYELLFDASLEAAVEAGIAMAEAVTRAFPDDLSDIVTFSAARFTGSDDDVGRAG